MKFCLKNAFYLVEVYDYNKSKKVVGFRAAFSTMYERKIAEATKSYNKLTKEAKELSHYLAFYRTKNSEVFKNSFYLNQLTILEGLKARRQQNAKFLKKLKWIKRFGTSEADRIASSISVENYLPINYKPVNLDFKKRLETVENGIKTANRGIK